MRGFTYECEVNPECQITSLTIRLTLTDAEMRALRGGVLPLRKRLDGLPSCHLNSNQLRLTYFSKALNAVELTPQPGPRHVYNDIVKQVVATLEALVSKN